QRTQLFIIYLFTQYDTGYSSGELFPRFGYIFEVPRLQKYWANNAANFRSELELMAQADELVITHNYTVSVRDYQNRLIRDIEKFLKADAEKTAE
ncbi:MAG: hypothetical protein ACE37D_09095, partial [Pseudomonadales bacterium]